MLGHSKDTATDRERVLSEDEALTVLFSSLFLWTPLWRFLCTRSTASRPWLSQPSRFHTGCTIRPVLEVIKMQHVLELSGAESSTESYHRNTDTESLWGARSTWCVSPASLLRSYQGMSDGQYSDWEKNQTCKQPCTSNRMRDDLQHSINLNSPKSTVGAFLSNVTEWKVNQLFCAKIHFFPNSSNVNSRIVQRFDTKSEAATFPSNSVHLRL